VFIHPSGYPQPDRPTRFYFNHVIANPLDTTVAMHHLIFDGVLERYSNLKIIATHGGGFLPACSGRINHAWGARTDAHGNLPKPPSVHQKKFYLDTIVFTPHQLEAPDGLFGPRKILLGTNYPCDMADYHPIEHIMTAKLSADDQAAICGRNARDLFGF
jgi:aminocarboxymuconate-semialdehyde decarboxylase